MQLACRCGWADKLGTRDNANHREAVPLRELRLQAWLHRLCGTDPHRYEILSFVFHWMQLEEAAARKRKRRSVLAGSITCDFLKEAKICWFSNISSLHKTFKLVASHQQSRTILPGKLPELDLVFECQATNSFPWACASSQSVEAVRWCTVGYGLVFAVSGVIALQLFRFQKRWWETCLVHDVPARADYQSILPHSFDSFILQLGCSPNDSTKLTRIRCFNHSLLTRKQLGELVFSSASILLLPGLCLGKAVRLLCRLLFLQVDVLGDWPEKSFYSTLHELLGCCELTAAFELSFVWLVLAFLSLNACMIVLDTDFWTSKVCLIYAEAVAFAKLSMFCKRGSEIPGKYLALLPYRMHTAHMFHWSLL